MPMISDSWAEALIPVIYKWFDIGIKIRPSLIPALYNVQLSDSAEETHIGQGGISPDAWDAYENTGNKAEAKWNKGFDTTFTHVEKPVTFQIERKFRDDDKSGIVSQRARKLGISAGQRRELDGASVFVNAFNDSFPGADAVGLCSLVHPDGPNDAGVQVNEGTLELNNSNVSTVRTAMSRFKDDEGNPIGVVPNLLLVPPELEDVALQAVNSSLMPDSGENNLNPQVGRWIVQPWHYLTDTGRWFMIDTVWMKESLIWYVRAPLEFMLVHQSTTEFVYEAYMRYSFGWTDWRWVYGNDPA